MDIERYNYVDTVLRKLRMGILIDELKSKSKGSNIEGNNAGDAKDEAGEGEAVAA